MWINFDSWIRGGVEDTRLEAKAKDTKKSEAKARTALPSTDPLEAKDTGASVLQKKRSSKIFFGRCLQKFFSGDLKNFNDLNNTAVLEPRTGQFSRT